MIAAESNFIPPAPAAPPSTTRPALPCDLAAVVRIARASFPEPDDQFGAAWLVRFLEQPGVELFVDSPGVGVVRGFALLERKATGTTLRVLATDAAHRRRGVAKRLIGMVTGPASAWVRIGNEASRKAFESAGWKNEPGHHTGEWVFYTI